MHRFAPTPHLPSRARVGERWGLTLKSQIPHLWGVKSSQIPTWESSSRSVGKFFSCHCWDDFLKSNRIKSPLFPQIYIREQTMYCTVYCVHQAPSIRISYAKRSRMRCDIRCFVYEISVYGIKQHNKPIINGLSYYLMWDYKVNVMCLNELTSC